MEVRVGRCELTGAELSLLPTKNLYFDPFWVYVRFKHVQIPSLDSSDYMPHTLIESSNPRIFARMCHSASVGID